MDATEQKIEELLGHLMEMLNDEILPLTTIASDEILSFRHIYNDGTRHEAIKTVLETSAEGWKLLMHASQGDFNKGIHTTVLDILMQTTIWTYCKGFTDAQKEQLATWKVAEEEK